MKEKSIAIIIPYFGTLPWYFDYFVHTCRHNETIDFYLITDDESAKKRVCKNIHVIITSFRELKAAISRKLGFKVRFAKAYKLCDFKPAYGYLFPEIIKSYDFWGHGDIDIIFGNLRKFLTNDILNRYDTISLRHDFITGYFHLFKNADKTNRLFMLSRDYKKVFASHRHYCFDETNFTFNEFNEEIHYSEIESKVESMTHLIKRLNEEHYITSYFDFHVIEGVPGRMKWENGTLTYKNRLEAALYHLIVFKGFYSPVKYQPAIPDTFYISPNRIYFR